MDISRASLETWGWWSPKSPYAWFRKLAVFLSVLIVPWFLIPWRYALLYVLLTLFVTDEVENVIPIIVAAAKQEIASTRKT